MADIDAPGISLHEGLELFLWKMSMPNTPSYNINTDIKYHVRMWFHNGLGQIMPNPFLSKVKTVYGDFRKNYEFEKHAHRGLTFGIGTGGGEGLELGEYCFDLTPFVQSIQLPPIGTSAETQVETLLGTMRVGAFSPYSSDGGREVTLNLLDTQYSILDAIFYPWLKMIGNAHWYDPANAYPFRTTPYPICTLEISTPMRWSPEPGGSQMSNKLTPYVYNYIGARPKEYDIPEINAEARSTLARRLSMVCDLVLVDLDRDSLVARGNEPREDGLITKPVPSGTQINIGDAQNPVTQDPDPASSTNNADPQNQQNQTNNNANDIDAAQNATNNAQNATDQQGNGIEPGTGGPAAGGGGGGAGPPVADGDNAPTSPSAPPAGGPPSALMRRDGDSEDDSGDDTEDSKTINDLICEEINLCNEKYYNLVESAKKCIRDNSKGLLKASTISRLKDLISEHFDMVLLNPLIKLFPMEKELENAMKRFTASMNIDEPTCKHHFDFLLPHIKEIGGLVHAVNPPYDVVGNYSRIITLNEAMDRIHDDLPDVATDPMQAALCLKAFEEMDVAPNNSIALLCETSNKLWFAGLYATPLHNILVQFNEYPNGKVLPTDTYPFLFKHEQFDISNVVGSSNDSFYEDTVRFGIIQDMIGVNDKEAEEYDLGDGYEIKSISVWEIVDDNHNHTGTYWCKAWITNGIKGRVYFCRVNYLGEVLRDPLPEVDGLQDVMVRTPYVDGEPSSEMKSCSWLKRTICDTFTKESHRYIYSQENDDCTSFRICKGGQYERHYNPLTAIENAEVWSRTVECLKNTDLDVQTETNFIHLEEFPRDGDVELSREYQVIRPNIRYTMYVYKDGQVHQAFYKTNRICEHEAQCMIDEYDGEVFQLKMGVSPAQYFHDGLDDEYPMLFVKRHNCWDAPKNKEEEAAVGTPYVLAHTTNWEKVPNLDPAQDTSNAHIFDGFIPESLEYVAEYKYQKKRFNAAVDEQRKFLQLCNRLHAKSMSAKTDLEDLQHSIDVDFSRDEIKQLCNILGKINEMKAASTVLDQSREIQNGIVEKARKEYDSMFRQFEETPHSNLPKKLHLSDARNVQRIALNKAVEKLADIEDKLNKIQAEYEKLERDLDALKNLVIEPGVTVLDFIIERMRMIYTAICDYNFITHLSNVDVRLKKFHRAREDRRVLIEKLIVFFDRHIDNIDAVIEEQGVSGVDVVDLILMNDWLAWGENTLSQEERDEANRESYQLRVHKLLPSLYEKLERLYRQRDRLRSQMEQATALVYDVDYAVPGYVAKDDSDEQEPIDFATDADRNPAIVQLMKNALATMVDKYKQIFSQTPTFMIEKDDSTDEKAFTKDSSKVSQQLIDFYKKFTSGGGKKVSEDVVVERDEKENEKLVISVYKSLNPSLSEASDDDVLNSLLLVLSSNYLKQDNPALMKQILDARGLIEKSKLIRDKFQNVCDKELELLTAAKDKRKGMLDAIAKLDGSNLGMLQKAGYTQLSRDEQRKFKSNVIKKNDLQTSIEELDKTILDMIDHYEGTTLKTMNEYKDNVEAARMHYDDVVHSLSEKVNFKDTLNELGRELSTIG